MRRLLEDIDVDRLQEDVEELALIDPQAGSVPGNYRSRFVLHPDMRESTEYIRAELAAVLGEEAVDVQAFPISRSTARSRVRENRRGYRRSRWHGVQRGGNAARFRSERRLLRPVRCQCNGRALYRLELARRSGPRCRRQRQRSRARYGKRARAFRPDVSVDDKIYRIFR